MPFPLIMLWLILICGLITLWDCFYLRKHRKLGQNPHWVIDYARTFFPLLIIIFLIRSFGYQPYRVPTGSLEPTVKPGDYILVNQYVYGLRLPLIYKKIWDLGQPNRGDIVLFHWPVNPRIIYAKRLIGLPGDHIVYKNRVLFINGKEAKQTLLGVALDSEPDAFPVLAYKREETLPGGKVHAILIHQQHKDEKSVDTVVPPGHYFMMGDNRDNSYDSRFWGMVEDKYLIGRALGVWMSFDSNHYRIRWHRIGKVLH